MKQVRYGNPGKEKPGLIDPHGKLRDLSDIVRDIGLPQLSPATLAKIRKAAAKTPLVRGTLRMGCPVSNIAKFIAIGLNCSDHAEEAGMAIPKEPIVFLKATSCIQGPDDSVMLPKGSVKGYWEVELAIVIGTSARYVLRKDVLSHFAGDSVVNDVSERECRLGCGPQWDKAKGCNTFGLIGPWLGTTDEIPNVQRLGIWLDVNDERMQTGTTKTMIFGIAKLVIYVSRLMTLLPGDVITTGTLPGVGMGMKPPRFLNCGARVSEVVDVRWSDLHLTAPRQVRLRGKGRKERLLPLWRETTEALHRLNGKATTRDQQHVLMNRHDQPLTRDGISTQSYRHRTASSSHQSWLCKIAKRSPTLSSVRYKVPSVE